MEKENKEIFNTLKQYKDVVDEHSIVSKATKEGIITFSHFYSPISLILT
ncbi:hypothetical protein N5T96_00530 [Aliarcobacter butzleri]|nr:hypothetical protein [Aliarcobacter butzleri]MCT7564819.1 hypothetical protein [Aliarcobacter butzleri]MCT7578349.1 hypothetical protein [Aliarcobacter butzleri]